MEKQKTKGRTLAVGMIFFGVLMIFFLGALHAIYGLVGFAIGITACFLGREKKRVHHGTTK